MLDEAGISPESDALKARLFAEAAEFYYSNRNAESVARFAALRPLLAHDDPRLREFYYHQINNLMQMDKRPDALILADEGVKQVPDAGLVWFLHGTLLHLDGQLAPAFRSLKRAWRTPEGHTEYNAYRLAAILVRYHRYRVALKLAEFARDEGLTWDGLQPLLAEIYVALRRPEEALENLRASRIPLKDHHWRLQEDIARAQIANRFRHVAIGGASYVGSTILGIVLGSLENCAHIGESQELIYWTDPASRTYRRFDAETEDNRHLVYCRVCGPDCAVLTMPFRKQISLDPRDWYRRLARRLDTPTLISSDKFYTQYEVMDPENRFDLIVLYKPVESWVRSFRRQEEIKRELGIPSLERETADFWLNNYTGIYQGLVKKLRPEGRRIVLNWERFVAQPAAHFDHLLKLLGLPGDAGVFDNIRVEHLIGGNDSGNIRAVIEEKRVRFRPSSAPPLTEADAAAIGRHDAARQVARQLDSLYHLSFGHLA